MSMTAEKICSVKFVQAPAGWPTEEYFRNVVDAHYKQLPREEADYTEVVIFRDGHPDHTFLFPETQLDHFTGHAIIEYIQERLTGESEDRAYAQRVYEANKTHLDLAFRLWQVVQKS